MVGHNELLNIVKVFIYFDYVTTYFFFVNPQPFLLW